MAETAARAEKPLLDLDVLEQASECLRTIAHPHRLRMIQMMLRGEYTVGELAESCEVPSHVASEHLMLMSRCGLLSREKRGRKVFYAVAEEHLRDILQCIGRRFGNES